MKRVLWAIVLLFTICTNAKADDINIGEWYCKVYENRDTLSILSYKGSSADILVPNQINYNNKDFKVTELRGLISLNSGIDFNSVFIPENIRKYSADLFSMTNCPPVVILENGNFYLENNIKLIPVSSRFNCLIILSPCKKALKDIFNDSDNCSKPGEIRVTFANNSQIAVQMFLNDRKTNDKSIFTRERLEYLQFALAQSKYKTELVKAIDLSGMSTQRTSVTIDLDDYSALFPNATIIATKGQLADKVDYTAPNTDYNGLISYQRTNTQYWNSVCLPFAIKESDFPEGTSIYCLDEVVNNKVYLKRIGAEESVPAGVPCYIYCDSNTPWDLQIYGTIAKGQAPVEQESNGWKLVGSFENKSLGTGKYKLNSAGNAFVTTTESSTVTAFRCYLAPANPSTAPARLEVGVDEEAEITLVPDDREPQRVKLYDLMGRPRRENAPGLFIRGK